MWLYWLGHSWLGQVSPYQGLPWLKRAAMLRTLPGYPPSNDWFTWWHRVQLTCHNSGPFWMVTWASEFPSGHLRPLLRWHCSVTSPSASPPAPAVDDPRACPKKPVTRSSPSQSLHTKTSALAPTLSYQILWSVCAWLERPKLRKYILNFIVIFLFISLSFFISPWDCTGQEAYITHISTHNI